MARDVLIGMSILLVGFVGALRLVRSRSWDRLALFLGIAGAVVGVAILVAPAALQPITQRYALGLLGPFLVAMACCLEASLPRRPVLRWYALGFLSLLLCVPLLDFSLHYVAALRRTGGDSEGAFRAGPVDPKQAAVAVILADLPNTHPPSGSLDRRWVVLTEDWWTMMPMTYFAQSRREVRIQGTVTRPSEMRKDVARYLELGQYVVGFAGGPVDQTVRAALPPEALVHWDLPDYAGRPAVVVYRLREVP
jgi:hypothetical protein